MEFTQEQLESMSDLELNMIASKLLNVLNVTVNHKKLFGAIKREGVTNITTHIDYCNKWSDCGDLIDELNDSMYLYVDADLASLEDGKSKFTAKHENNKRAVTIVYILVKQFNG